MIPRRQGAEEAVVVRALGPGSVSSFLKAVLDVIFYALIVTAGVTALAALVSLLAQPFVGGRADRDFGILTDFFRAGPALSAVLAVADVYVAALIVVVERTRRVFGTMIAGDPFDPTNVSRLRVIGFALAAMELTAWLARAVARALLPQMQGVKMDVNLTAWFAVLVVFVLAEVFREGARLRSDAELTV